MKLSDIIKREMEKSGGKARVVDVDKSQTPTLESMTDLINNVKTDMEASHNIDKKHTARRRRTRVLRNTHDEES